MLWRTKHYFRTTIWQNSFLEPTFCETFFIRFLSTFVNLKLSSSSIIFRTQSIPASQSAKTLSLPNMQNFNLRFYLNWWIGNNFRCFACFFFHSKITSEFPVWKMKEISHLRVLRFCKLFQLLLLHLLETVNPLAFISVSYDKVSLRINISWCDLLDDKKVYSTCFLWQLFSDNFTYFYWFDVSI